MNKRDGQDTLRALLELNVSIPACFERVAEAYSTRTALVSDGGQLTYAELNAAANRLAHTIVSHGGAPGDRVAILMQHDAPAIAVVVAVLKAGRIVVALNSTHPLARLRELIDDSEPFLIVTDTASRNLAMEIGERRCAVVSFEEHWAKGPDHNLSILGPPEQVAALSYTSGSTGRPKGVMVTHRQIQHFVSVHTEAMEFSAEDRISLFSSLSVQQGINIMWCALLNGAALCPFPVIVKGVTGLADWMAHRGITVYASSASIFRNFMKTLEPNVRLHRIRAVRVSSEPVTSDDFRQFKRHFPPACWFVISLSSTETSNIAWSRRLSGDAVPEGHLPIGVVVSKGQEVLILDEGDRPVAPGQIGEIVVRSRYVAAGYWRNPQLTAERFSGEVDGTGTRLVRTGDLGLVNSAGILELRGRRDDRVKIRGNRVELSEIAEVLNRLGGVDRAVVEVVARRELEPVLVGFVVAKPDAFLKSAELRRALRTILPDAMVPSSIVLLDSFPITAGGKIDREALRHRYVPLHRPDPEAGRKTETESLLASIWGELFGVDEVSAGDDFFELGGNSLAAAVVAARIQSVTGVDLNLETFADYPTLSALASLVDERRGNPKTEETPLVRVSRKGPVPLSFAQERAWLASQTENGLRSYVHADLYRITGPLDRGILRECLSYLVRRHEILRTTFPTINGMPVQLVQDPEPIELPYFDVASVPDVEREANRILKEQAARAIDLARLPLIHYSLIRVRENEHWMQRIRHHIVTDAWSSRMFYREMAQLYAARCRGEPLPVPKMQEFQFADYAAWERQILRQNGSQFRKAMEWWKQRLSDHPEPLKLSCRRPSPRGVTQRSQSGRGPAQPSPADGILQWRLDPHISQRLEQLGRTEGATSFVVRVAAFVAQLALEAGQDDVLLGTYIYNRNRLVLQSIHGYFVNLVALRFKYEPNKSFREWLPIIRKGVNDAEARGIVPFKSLCNELERSGAGRPPIDIIVNMSSSEREMEFAGLEDDLDGAAL